MSPAMPKKFGNWEVIRKEGSGGFSSAYLAKHIKYGKKVIIKQLDPVEANKLGARDLHYFVREAKILSQLDSKYISKLLDYDFQAAKPWMAIQYFPGTTLWDYIEQGSVVNEAQWFQMAHDILSALEYAHSKGVVHRDLNPKNIILFYEGARLIDFGLSRFTDDPNSTRIVGFNGFVAPEIELGDPKPSLDIFVAATALSAAGTGRMPWRAEGGSYYKSITTDAPDYKGLTANQIALLKKMHSKNPSERVSAKQALKLIEELAPTTAGVQIPQRKQVKPVVPTPPLQEPKPSPKSPKVAQPVKSADQKVREFIDRKPVIAKANKNSTNWLKDHKELVILGFLTGGWAWIIYAIVSLFPKVGKLSYKPRAFYALNMTIGLGSIGLLSPFVTAYWYKKLRTKRLLSILIFQSLLVISFFYAAATTPNGGTIPTWTAFVWLTMFLSPLLISPEIYRYFAKDEPKASGEVKEPKAASGESKPNNDTDTSEPDASSPEYTKAHANWAEVEEVFKSQLVKIGKKRFVIGIESNHIKGIFIQGYSEPDGAFTIEAAADLSVRPKVTVEQRANLNSLGWDSPDEGLPNFIQFLAVEDSNVDFMARLFTETLKDGYGLNIGTFKVIN